MAFLIAPLIAGLAGLFAGSAMKPKMPPLPPPPDTPIRPTESTAAERVRRSAPRSGGGLPGLVLTPLGGGAKPANKSLLGQ